MSDAFDTARLYQRLRRYVDTHFTHSVTHHSIMTGATVRIAGEFGQPAIYVDGVQVSASNRIGVAYALQALPALKAEHDRAEMQASKQIAEGLAFLDREGSR